jgi:DNA replication protein DnaC
MNEAKPISSIVGAVLAAIPEQDDAREQARARFEQTMRDQQFNSRVSSNWSDFSRRVGDRYKDCSLDNFTETTDEQRQVMRNLRAYVDSIRENVKAGRGVLLFGPKGTGKDHLLSGLAWEFVKQFRYVTWRNGVDLFGEVRDAMSSDGSEREFVSRLVKPDVLYISDPLPPAGKLTEFQSSMLFRILDGRYRAMRPTWVSVNATGRKDLEDRMGSQNADRLRDGTLTLFCGWPSHRKPAEVKK